METLQTEKKPRAHVPMQIIVLRGHNLKGVRGVKSITFVRLEFSNIHLGDSQKHEASADEAVEYNFTTSFDCSTEDPVFLDDVAHKPLILTVIEVLPKEKKQKEEKTVVLAQATVGLLPLLHRESNFSLTVPLHSLSTSPLDIADPDKKPSLEVIISVPEPLLSRSQESNGNLLKVTLETAYSIPETWTPTGPQYNYVVGLQVPTTAEKDQHLVFSNGVLKLGGDKEPTPRPKKWSISPVQVSNAMYVTDTVITGGPYEEEDGDLNLKEYKDHRAEVETVKKRVTWDTERCCYIDPAAVMILQKRIAERRLWPVEIMRLPLASPTKAKVGKGDKLDDDTPISFHGVAFVNMVPLLYPGVQRLRGAFRVYAYNDAEVLAKTKCQSSVLRDVLRQGSLGSRLGMAPAGASSPHAKGATSRIMKEDKAPRDSARKTSLTGKVAELVGPETEGPATVLNVEGQLYTDSGTYILLELVLDKALVRKREPEELARQVKDLIPPRPPLTRRTAGAKKAESDYHSQIVTITTAVLDEYRQLFGNQMITGKVVDSQTLEEQKCHLNYELNCTGKYFAFKEQLKHAVVKIVREKYMKTTAFQDPDMLQAFLSELYVYLVDQMHVALNQTLSDDTACPPPPSFLNLEQLRHFAREAELNEDFEQAAAYYEERLVRDRQSIQHWLDFGAFNLLIKNYIKAQECFHEAAHLDQKHLNSVLLCGITAVLLDRYSEGEIFFEDATCIYPTSIVAWTLLGLLYETQENDIQMDMAFQEAGKLRQAKKEEDMAFALATAASQNGEGNSADVEVTQSAGTSANTTQEATPGMNFGPQSSTKIPKCPSIFMETIHFLIKCSAVQLIQQTLSHELLSHDGGPSGEYYLAMAHTHLLKKEFQEAEENLSAAAQINYQDPDVWAMTGHLHFLRGEKSDAKACYEHTISYESDASETHPIFLRLGSIYLEEGEYQKARDTYLHACRTSPTCLTWLGVGIACYRMGNLQEAEDALSEANTLNNTDAVVWGYLALVCLKTGRQLEAEQSYKYMKKLNLQDQALLQEVHEMQELVGFGNPSF